MTTPSPLELIIDTLIDAVLSHALASGYFDAVNGHEPKSIPGHNLTAAVWQQRIKPVPARSGLNSTSGLVVMNVRLYTSMLTEPLDMIDPHMTKATSALMAAYSSDFTLDGLISNVDLLGAHGFTLESLAGYVTINNVMLRTMTLTVPCVINDLFTQAP